MAEQDVDVNVPQAGSSDVEGSVVAGQIVEEEHASGVLLKQFKTENGYNLIEFNRFLAEKIETRLPVGRTSCSMRWPHRSRALCF